MHRGEHQLADSGEKALGTDRNQTVATRANDRTVTVFEKAVVQVF